MAKIGRPRKSSLRPIDDNIENDSVEMDYDDINPQTEPEVTPEGKIRVENNIDFFNTQENDPDFSNNIHKVDVSNYEKEIESLRSELDTLKNENSILRGKNLELESVVEKLKQELANKTNEIISQNSIKSIQDENDNLLLKNSELELELSKIRCQLKNNTTIGKPSQTQVYSREHYSSIPGNVSNRKNGYQDWN